jgi:ectoine hydroxylase-related dioxygenase (phytanoyl-CoA dioxygenase family)
VRALAANATVIELLRFLYQREPIPFQTLNFDSGTGYATHSDVIHFYSFPHRYMCCVWIALEATDADNGPIFCCPGSHKLPDFSLNDVGLTRGFDDWPRFEHFMTAVAHAHHLERREVHLKRGQALIWAANTLHGGSPVRDPRRSRHSQVTHYFFEDCVWWIPGCSDSMVGEPCLREVIDIRRGRFMTPRYHGRPLDLDRFPRVWRYPRPLPEWVGAEEESAA